MPSWRCSVPRSCEGQRSAKWSFGTPTGSHRNCTTAKARRAARSCALHADGYASVPPPGSLAAAGERDRPSSDSRSSRRPSASRRHAAGLPPPTPASQAPKHTACISAHPALARTEPGTGGGGGSNHHLGHHGSTCRSHSSGGRHCPWSTTVATRRKGAGKSQDRSRDHGCCRKANVNGTPGSPTRGRLSESTSMWPSCSSSAAGSTSAAKSTELRCSTLNCVSDSRTTQHSCWPWPTWKGPTRIPPTSKSS
mmetsp:Transcript_4579/g.9349  ORF Transcript_4579/g.9349 Transcript_4579/m.9349 type:complete len:252 (-) Transcript_4579:490-1245(-)